MKILFLILFCLFLTSQPNQMAAGKEGCVLQTKASTVQDVSSPGMQKTITAQMPLAQSRESNSMFLIFVVVLVLVILTVTAIYIVQNRKTTRLLKEKNAQLEEANKKLKASEKNLRELIATKDKFFSIIAHDIRSPLSSFLSLAEALAKNMNFLDENEKKELTVEMSKSAANINDLLENLLQWARSQTGTIRYNPNTIDLHEIIDNTVYLLKGYAEKKKIRIVPEIKGNPLAFADSNMVFTVLRNLVSNAIKFSMPQSNITISTIRNNGFVEISVRDEGVGIQKEDMENLFRIDVHHSTEGTSNEKGTGLGLILCHEFVEKNGGYMSVESEPGKGSNFSFTLPGSEN